jgi:uncharacterized protein YidB (DUF937 family)
MAQDTHMGLLDSIIGGLTGNAGGASPLQGVLTSLLSGGQQTNQGTQNPSQGFDANSLGTLVNSFQQAGLGHLVESWIGNGPNQSVSPQQLHSVLGDNQVQQMSAQSGMAPQDFLSQLSQHLPNVVNSMTPHGQLPDEGSMSV